MSASPFLPLPSTLGIDLVEHEGQKLLVSLHATTQIAPCPRCGMPGSRVHSRYTRTVADVACGGQRLVLKLTVRKWVCSAASCSQRIFAERFPGFLQTYARMTDRRRRGAPVRGDHDERSRWSTPVCAAWHADYWENDHSPRAPASASTRCSRSDCWCRRMGLEEGSAVWHDPGRSGTPSRGGAVAGSLGGDDRRLVYRASRGGRCLA